LPEASPYALCFANCGSQREAVLAPAPVDLTRWRTGPPTVPWLRPRSSLRVVAKTHRTSPQVDIRRS